MPAISTLIAAGGLALAGAGTAMQFSGAKAASKATASVQALQQAQEAERAKSMELDAMRRKREIVRQGIAARSVSLATASNQGAAGEGGSAVPGAQGGIAGRTNESLLATNQSLELGRNMFDLKSREGVATAAYSKAQSYTGFGAGLSSLGGAMIKNMEAFSRVGTYAGGYMSGERGMFGTGPGMRRG